MSIISLLHVFIGGGVGAVGRWLLSLLAASLSFPAWAGTLFANLIGCTLIFIFMKFYQEEFSHWSLLFKVGFLGGLTTFSSFAYEIVDPLVQGRYQEFLLVFGLNILLGIVVGFVILR